MADILEKKKAKRSFRSSSLPALAGMKTARESTSIFYHTILPFSPGFSSWSKVYLISKFKRHNKGRRIVPATLFVYTMSAAQPEQFF